MFRNAAMMTSVIALSTALAVSPALSQKSAEAEATAKNRGQVEESVEASKNKEITKKRDKLLDEAVSALEQTEKAIGLIDEEKTSEAIDALAVATGKLATIVARSPDLALAPVNVTYVSKDIVGDVKAIEKLGDDIEALVDDGKFQEARRLMDGFASELVVSTTNLPLATYPAAILEATALLEEKKTSEAKTILETALSTQVVVEAITPLPPVRAEAMLEKVREELDGTAADAESNETASEAKEADEIDVTLTPKDYVEAARQELRIAEALGYGSEQDFEKLHDELNQLDSKIDGKEDSDGMFSRIADSFKDLKSRIFGGSKEG